MGNIYSWGRNAEGQFGDNALVSTLIGLYSDGFENSVIDNIWTQDPGTGGTFSETASAGLLTIGSGSGGISLGSYNPTYIYQIVNESADFEVVVKMYFADTINADFETAGMIIELDNSNYIKFGVTYNSSQSPPKHVQCAHDTGGGRNQLRFDAATSPIWFKVTRDGQDIECFFSNNGTDFTAANPTSGNLLTTTEALKVALYASHVTSGVQFNVSFDNFTVTPVSLSGASVEAAGDHDFIDIAGGRNHSLGLKNNGSVWTWGDNTYGQLGNNSTTNTSSPVSVVGNKRFIEIAPASDHNLAIDENGNVFSWGRNDYGQLGLNNTSNKSSPESIGKSFLAVSTGLDHSLAIDYSGNVWAWGRNQSGQLGTGDTTNRSTPTLVSGLPTKKFIKVTGGAEHSCAQTEDGDIWCWGGNEYSQTSSIPLSVAGIGAFRTGGGALDINTGYMWTWGQNYAGQLGDGTTTQRSSPVTVVGPQGWGFYELARSLGAEPCNVPGNCTGTGQYNTTGWATKPDGSLWMWGDGRRGTLGNGSFNVSRSSPVSVLNSGNIKFFTAVGAIISTYALSSNGELYVWGDTSYILDGAATVPTSVNSPIEVEPIVFDEYGPFNDFVGGVWRWLSASQRGGLVGDGRDVMGWGNNENGKLCNNALGNYRSYPVTIPGSSWLQAAHGQNNTIWLDVFGHVYMCGYNDPLGGMSPPWFGGGGPTYRSTHTIVVGSPHNAILVRAGQERQYHGFLREDGSLWMWGYNQYGGLGVGDTTSRTSPTSVLGSGQSYSFVDFLLTGQYGTIALDTEGQIWAWGRDEGIGDNTVIDKYIPTKTSLGVITPEAFKTATLVTSGGPVAVDLDAGGYHNIILDENYRAWTWGRNDLGQLGNNTLTETGVPQSVYGDHRFIDISAGELHTYALKADGTVCTWGEGDWGKLLYFENQSDKSIPQCGSPISLAPCVDQLPNTGNYQHSTLLKCSSIYQAWTWGCNDDGKLGDGTIAHKSTPTSVIGDKKWIDMSGGGNFTIALDDDGKIWAWGDDSLGQLGDG